jgi:hypothetical protein
MLCDRFRAYLAGPTFMGDLLRRPKMIKAWNEIIERRAPARTLAILTEPALILSFQR